MIDKNRVWNYQKIAMCNYIYCGVFQWCQIKKFNESQPRKRYIIMPFLHESLQLYLYVVQNINKMYILCETWFSLCICTWNVIACFFSVNVKLVFEVFVMGEKANYLYMKLFSEEEYRALFELQCELYQGWFIRDLSSMLFLT